MDLISTPVYGADPTHDYVYTLGPQAGIYLSLGIFDLVAVLAEFYYIRIGEIMESEYGYIVNMSDYLEFSLLVNIRMGGEAFSFNVYGGPDVLWRIEDETAIEIYDTDDNKLAEVILTEDDMYRWLFRMIMGIGIKVGVGNFVFSLDIRYAAPLHDCYTDNVQYNDYGLNAVQLLAGVGYKFF